MIEIERIRRSMTRERFLTTVFGKAEYAELESTNFSAPSVAACFAAKEAFGKALGTGIRGFRLSDVEVLHEDNGRPYFFLSGCAEQLCRERGLCFSLSITHTRDYALAFVVAFTQELL